MLQVKTREVLATNRGMNVVIVSQDQVGSLFVSTLVRVNEKEVRYLGISVNRERLAQIKSGEMTLREAFLNRTGCWIDAYAKSPMPNIMDSKVRTSPIPEAYLPPDARLRPNPAQLDISQSMSR
jgi:hypothetical protein